jgi:L-proline cis-4-hydroxylase
MNTHRIAKVDLDTGRLALDLETAAGFHYSDSYSEFICGEWHSCMLWNASGKVEDTQLCDYSGAAQQTDYGKALPYLRELMEHTFDLSKLRFARLVKLRPNSVIIPHRDFLELGQTMRRVHLPLQTDAHCFSAEEATVYQMRTGEIWFIDASKVHTAASFSKRDRLHLILDFTQGDEIESVLNIEASGQQAIPAENIVARPAPDAAEEETIASFSHIVDLDNYRDILALLIRRYFRKAFHAATVFDRLLAMAERAGKITLVETIRRHRDYCLIAR